MTDISTGMTNAAETPLAVVFTARPDVSLSADAVVTFADGHRGPGAPQTIASGPNAGAAALRALKMSSATIIAAVTGLEGTFAEAKTDTGSLAVSGQLDDRGAVRRALVLSGGSRGGAGPRPWDDVAGPAPMLSRSWIATSLTSPRHASPRRWDVRVELMLSTDARIGRLAAWYTAPRVRRR